MNADQKPAPVQGEDTQVISVDGIDREALPESAEEPNEQPSPESPPLSEPSVSSDETPQAEDNGESEQSESLGTDAQTEEPSTDATEMTEAPVTDTVQPSPTNVTPTESTQSPKSAEEQQLAETAIEDREGTLAALTTPIESIDFIAAGITWDSDTSEDITEAAVRVREQGEWSAWHDLEVHATDEEMKAQSTRAGTEPLITVSADAVQARVHTRSGEAPKGLQVSLIDPGESATDGQLEPASAESNDVEVIDEASPASNTSYLENGTDKSAQPANEQLMRSVSARAPLQTARSNDADVIKPAIITRAQWGADESITSTSPQSRELKAMYVHHTAGTNDYSRANAYAQVRAIHRYHAGTLGWPDIGYQFLIDRYGTIYEGRRGSIDSLPLGAQAGGFNTNTIGISTIGNFDEASPPAGMVESLKKVLAWKGFQYGINANGTTRLTAGRGSSSKYSEGTRVTVNTILGHRDTNATVCPGRYLYSQLPAIRRDVATRITNAGTTAPPSYDTITPGLKYQAQDNTVLRAEPSSKSTILKGLPRGTKVTTANHASGRWWKVTVNGTTGWIAHQHFTPSYDTITSGLKYQAQDNTVLRAEPSSKSTILKGLPRGTKVTTANHASGRWWKVTVNGTTGWIAHQHFTPSSK